MDQVLNVYKPIGRTSFSVVGEIRRRLKIKKVGHAGTLDPLADGVLIVLTGNMTKQQESFMHQEKEYLAKIAFGFSTYTYDLEGDFVDKFPGITDPKKVEDLIITLNKTLPDTLKLFEGDLMQEVPAFSAVKISGRRLYDMARKNDIQGTKLPVKSIKIHKIDLLSLKTEYLDKIGSYLPVATIRVTCGSGTYIRSLANDLGKKLSVPSVLSALTRTRIGNLTIENSIKLENLENL